LIFDTDFEKNFNLTMNNDTFEVNTHEAQGTQGKVALKNWSKATHNF